MNYFKRLIIAVICLVGLGICCQSTPVLAEPRSVLVNPSLKEITISPTQTQITFPLHVRNNSQSEVTLLLSVVDFGALDETGGVAFLGSADSLERRYGLAGWSGLEKSSTVLPPGKSDEVKITIYNRPNLALGGHYGAVLFKVTAPGGNDPKKIKLNQVFSSLILLKKTGGEMYDLSLNRLELENNRFRLPESIKLRFKNAGNVHVAPGGVVRIIDPLGREVARGAINPEASRILPEKNRVFLTQLSSTELAWVPGRYHTIVEYNFDERGDFTRYETSFLFVNGWGIVLMVGLCGALFFALLKREKIKFRLKKFYSKFRPKPNKQTTPGFEANSKTALPPKNSTISLLAKKAIQLKIENNELSKKNNIPSQLSFVLVVSQRHSQLKKHKKKPAKKKNKKPKKIKIRYK